MKVKRMKKGQRKRDEKYRKNNEPPPQYTQNRRQTLYPTELHGQPQTAIRKRIKSFVKESEARLERATVC